jgi:hypothetical protein
MLRGSTECYKNTLKQQMAAAWYAGYYSQTDLKKANLQDFLDRFEDPDVVEARKQAELDEGKELWGTLNRNKI